MLQEFSKIPMRFCFRHRRAKSLARRVNLFLIHVTQGHQVLLEVEQFPHHTLHLAAQSDAGDAKLLIGRFVLGARHARRQPGRQKACRQGRGVNEMPPVEVRRRTLGANNFERCFLTSHIHYCVLLLLREQPDGAEQAGFH